MMLYKTELEQYRSILCLNGHLPEKTFFLDSPLPVIAADGAANLLHQLGIIPEIIIGDLDSVSALPCEKSKILYKPDQNTSDYQKSLDYLKEHDLLPSIVVGINGGYLDHILNNINIFLETDSLLYAPPLLGFVVKENTERLFSLPYNTKISLFGIPNALVTSKGLKWELKQDKLFFPGTNSCFNRTLDSSIHIQVHQGATLVLIYDEPNIDAGSLT